MPIIYVRKGTAMKPLVFMLIFLPHPGVAAFERNLAGPGASGPAGAVVSVTGNPWMAIANPGGLPFSLNALMSVSYIPQQFGLKELAHGSVSYIQPLPFGTIAFSGTSFGFQLYREVTLGLSYASRVTDDVGVGVTMNFYSLSIQNYGSARTAGLDAGVSMTMTDEIRWGIAATNVNSPRIGKAKERLPQTYTTGVSYSPFDATLVALDLVKDVRYPASVRVGIEYKVVSMLSIRAGTTTEPSSMHLGAGIGHEPFRLDYAFSSHPDLGGTHHFSLTLSIGSLVE